MIWNWDINFEKGLTGDLTKYELNVIRRLTGIEFSLDMIALFLFILVIIQMVKC